MYFYKIILNAVTDNILRTSLLNRNEITIIYACVCVRASLLIYTTEEVIHIILQNTVYWRY